MKESKGLSIAETRKLVKLLGGMESVRDILDGNAEVSTSPIVRDTPKPKEGKSKLVCPEVWTTLKPDPSLRPRDVYFAKLQDRGLFVDRNAYAILMQREFPNWFDDGLVGEREWDFYTLPPSSPSLSIGDFFDEALKLGLQRFPFWAFPLIIEACLKGKMSLVFSTGPFSPPEEETLYFFLFAYEGKESFLGTCQFKRLGRELDKIPCCTVASWVFGRPKE